MSRHVEQRKFNPQLVLAEHLEPDEVSEELRRRGVTGVKGVPEQRKALKTIIRDEEGTTHVVNEDQDPQEEFQQCEEKVRHLTHYMKLYGIDPYVVKVCYSRWAVLEDRIWRLSEKEGSTRVCRVLLNHISDIYDGYYRTENDEDDVSEILSGPLNELSLKETRPSRPLTKPDMQYRSPRPIMSSRESSPGRNETWNNQISEVGQRDPPNWKTPVTTGAIPKVAQNKAKKTDEDERRMKDGETKTARAYDDGRNAGIFDLGSPSPTRRRWMTSENLTKTMARNNDDEWNTGILDQGPLFPNPDAAIANEDGLSVRNRTIDPFHDIWQMRNPERQQTRPQLNKKQTDMSSKPVGKGLSVPNHPLDPRTETNSQEKPQNVPNCPTMVLTDATYPAMMEDQNNFQRQYEEMCEGLLQVVQSTVKEFLRSRSPTLIRRTHLQPSGTVSRFPPPLLDEKNHQTVSSQTSPAMEGRRSEVPRGVPIAKWPIDKFSGKEEDLARFLARIKSLAIAENASKEDLFRNRVHLFTGIAGDFVTLNNHINDWDSLVEEVRRFTMGSTSDCDLLRKIQERKQGKRENCAVYVTHMEMLFKNLRRALAESDRCDIIIRGMRPTIRATLAGNPTLTSLHDLRLAAQRVEKLTLTSPEFGEEEISAVNRERRGQAQLTPTGLNQAMKDFCFNCGDKTHRRPECTNGKQLICYECGKKGVHVSRCCNRSGNDRRGD